MGDTICSWKKTELKAKYLLKVVNQPKFFCKECGRVANKKKYLCDPKKLVKNPIN
jgi:hypothetical protein